MPASRNNDPHLWSDPLPNELRENQGKYSVARAIRRMADGRFTRPQGLEGEVSDELARRMGLQAPPHAFYLPWSAEVRSFDTAAGAGGIPTILDRRLIDVLRAKMIATALGARIYPDLRGGKFAIPRKSATASVGWAAEGTAPAISNPVIDTQALFIPHTTGAVTGLSRIALHSLADPEAWIIDDLLASIAVSIDAAILNGPGTSNAPTGLMFTPGIPAVALGTNGGVMTRDAAIACEKTVGLANGDVGALAWAGTPQARAAMRAIEVGTAGGRFLWGDDGRILEYPAVATTSMPSNLSKGTTASGLSALLFGNWRDVIVGVWGPAMIMVNPFKYSATGHIEITALQDVDVALRQVGSFVKIPDMVAA